MEFIKSLRLFASYIKNIVKSWYFPVAIILYAAVLFISTYGDYKVSETAGAEYFIHYAFMNGSTSYFLPVICALASATVFCREWISGYFVFTCSRIGKFGYIAAIQGSAALSAFIVSALGTLIYFGIICIKFPIISTDPNLINGIIQGYTYGGLIGEGKIMLYYALTIILQGAFSALLSSAAVVVSMFIVNPYLTIVSPMVLYIVVSNAMSVLSLPRMLNPYYVFSNFKYVNIAFGDTGENTFNLIAGLYPFTYAIAFIILASIFMYLIISKKYERREV